MGKGSNSAATRKMIADEGHTLKCSHLVVSKERSGDCLSGPAGAGVPFVMIKPTHYDDDGYPIQWFRSAIPSNTLACLNALAEDARGRNVLGPDVEIRLHTYDETNRRVQPVRIIREIR
jgi:hypothetical protein